MIHKWILFLSVGLFSLEIKAQNDCHFFDKVDPQKFIKKYELVNNRKGDLKANIKNMIIKEIGIHHIPSDIKDTIFLLDSDNLFSPNYGCLCFYFDTLFYQSTVWKLNKFKQLHSPIILKDNDILFYKEEIDALLKWDTTFFQHYSQEFRKTIEPSYRTATRIIIDPKDVFVERFNYFY